MVYGFHVKPTNDPYVLLAESASEAGQGLIPGAFLVDALPFCMSLLTFITHN